MINFFLKWRYILFKKWLFVHDYVSEKQLLFDANMKSFIDFNVINEEMYNHHPVYFKESAVYINKEGINLRCYKNVAKRITWQGARLCFWSAGMINTKNLYECINGTWEIEAKICDSWPAIWLMKIERPENGYQKDQITPEIDIMEVINGRVEQNVHWGYSDDQYVRWHKRQKLNKCDNKFHKFAVEMLSNGYNFYIDGILTTRFRSKNKQFVSDVPNYLILNNAASTSTTKNTVFTIKSVKVWK